MLTHGEICNIQLLKNLVLNPKDGQQEQTTLRKKEKDRDR